MWLPYGWHNVKFQCYCDFQSLSSNHDWNSLNLIFDLIGSLYFDWRLDLSHFWVPITNHWSYYMVNSILNLTGIYGCQGWPHCKTAVPKQEISECSEIISRNFCFSWTRLSHSIITFGSTSTLVITLYHSRRVAFRHIFMGFVCVFFF